MMQVTRTVAAALAALTLVVGAAGAVLAADPSPVVDTLGAEVTTNIYLDEHPYIRVINLGTIPTTFTHETPEGWSLEPSSMTLGPNESGSFLVTGKGDEGFVVIEGFATDASTAGADRNVIQFGSIHVAQSRPFDPTRFLPPIIFGGALIIGALLLLWKVKPWQYRLTRSGGGPA